MAANKDTDKNKDLQLVPETLLKRRHDLDDIKARREAQVVNNNKKFSKSGKFYVKKPERFLAQATSRKNHEIRFNRVLKKGMQKRASNKKLVDTKRVEEPNGDETEIQYQNNSVGANMVFVYDEKNRKLLHLVEPWVMYGTPSKEMVSDLINRRGHGRVNKERIPLSDNTIIETALGETSGIICVEDLVHELYEAGEAFDTAANFLWPFRLAVPKTRFQTQKLNDKEGRVYGDRGQEIDYLVKQML
ncbi:Ribosomal protein L30p/L7e [Fragilaria crotonensis]|nr:Ribosomal protein L30p/L7e [Fragilaria crotonensis]